MMLLFIEVVAERNNHLYLICILVSSWIEMFRSITFLMMNKQEMTWLTLIKWAHINSHACLISCIQLLIQLCNVILFCSMFKWTCNELVYVSVFKVSMLTFLNTSATWRRIWFWSVSNLYSLLDSSFIENMLHTLHATYIRHNLYADFLLSEK